MCNAADQGTSRQSRRNFCWSRCTAKTWFGSLVALINQQRRKGRRPLLEVCGKHQSRKWDISLAPLVASSLGFQCEQVFNISAQSSSLEKITILSIGTYFFKCNSWFLHIAFLKHLVVAALLLKDDAIDFQLNASSFGAIVLKIHLTSSDCPLIKRVNMLSKHCSAVENALWAATDLLPNTAGKCTLKGAVRAAEAA